jgi:ADP-ribosyl-[dinitrogen reductase] hydrolase
MRTAPVALAYVHDPHALSQAAHLVSALTHYDPEAGEACAMWCLAIRYGVLHGSFEGLRLAVADLAEDRATAWSARFDEAEALPPAAFDRNGWVVHAIQGAWSAICRTAVPATNPTGHLQLALEAAVRGGGDTDTVAAIAGGLLGARWGAAAIPQQWSRLLHGWSDMNATDLASLALRTVGADR